jgi:hypothetical protein
MQCGDVPPLDQRILPDGLRDEAPYARKWLTRRLGEERAGLGEQRQLARSMHQENNGRQA